MFTQFCKTGFALLALCLIAIPTTATERIITDSEITDVKIYQSGATVTRKKKFTIDAGQTTLRFENLPAAINPASIMVNATGGFTILSVTHQLDYLGPDRKTAEMIKLEDSLQNLNRKRETVINQLTAHQEEFNLLVANKSIGGANSGVKLDELKNISAFFRERIFTNRERMAELNVTEKKLKEEIDKINKQLNILNRKRNEPYSTIVVNVLAKEKATSDFTITYFTGGVSWYPSYDLKVKDSNSPVELVLKAMVNQSTGEDWTNIRFKISNGNPAIGQTKPDLYPWYLSFLQPVQIRTNGNAAVQKSEVMQEEKMMMDSEGASGLAGYVAVSDHQFSTEHEVIIPYSIPSDGLHYTVQLKEYSLKAAYSFYVTPKLDSDAFLLAHITGWEEHNLQPGNANIHFENNFIGETYFNPTTDEDTLQVSLGRDKRIVVKREMLRDVGSNQLIGSNRTRSFTFETSVRNNRKEPIIITIEDQVPVSRDKDIEVKVIEKSGGELDETTGKITWKIEVTPSAQMKKVLGYQVKYPKDMKVMGL